MISKPRKWLLYSVTFIILILIWQIQAFRIGNATLFPYPINVLEALIRLLGETDTYVIILFSLFRLLVALLMSFTLGITLGVLSGFFVTLDTLFSPVVSGLRSLPVASLIVIILILYGQQRAVYIIGFLMVFPIMFEASLQGVKNVDQTIINAAKLEKVPKGIKIGKVFLPLAFPYIKTGFLQSIGLGFKVLVMAEFISQTQRSIGRMLYLGRINIQYADVFAWTIIIIGIVLLIELFIHKLKEA